MHVVKHMCMVPVIPTRLLTTITLSLRPCCSLGSFSLFSFLNTFAQHNDNSKKYNE